MLDKEEKDEENTDFYRTLIQPADVTVQCLS